MYERTSVRYTSTWYTITLRRSRVHVVRRNVVLLVQAVVQEYIPDISLPVYNAVCTVESCTHLVPHDTWYLVLVCEPIVVIPSVCVPCQRDPRAQAGRSSRVLRFCRVFVVPTPPPASGIYHTSSPSAESCCGLEPTTIPAKMNQGTTSVRTCEPATHLSREKAMYCSTSTLVRRGPVA